MKSLFGIVYFQKFLNVEFLLVPPLVEWKGYSLICRYMTGTCFSKDLCGN